MTENNGRWFVLLMVVMFVFSSLIIVDNIGLRKEIKDIINHKLLDIKPEISDSPNYYSQYEIINYTKVIVRYEDNQKVFYNVTSLIRHKDGWKELDSDGNHIQIMGDFSYLEYKINNTEACYFYLTYNNGTYCQKSIRLN